MEQTPLVQLAQHREQTLGAAVRPDRQLKEPQAYLHGTPPVSAAGAAS